VRSERLNEKRELGPGVEARKGAISTKEGERAGVEKDGRGEVNS